MGNLISEETLHKLEADTSFQQLSQKMQTLNIFEVLGITNAEIRHSNFLAWLLDPNGNHGMGDKFLREFVSKLGQREVVPENVTVCIVRREWQHIDLLVLCQKEKYLLCVENKVFSGEHDDQLRRYRDMLLEEYPGYTMSFAFLSPDGIAPLSADDQQYWQPVSYADILDAIESAKGGSALLPEVNMLLDHYTAAVRRHIVGDDNIKKLCQDFYDRHKEVLDTIYENCKTSLNPICEVVEDWCREKSEQGELIFSPQWSNNTYALVSNAAYDYGHEAINTLVKRLEDSRRDFVCIMAGYTNEMNQMLSSNPGLRDRIQFYIDFPDYSAEELVQIYCKYAESEAYQLGADAKVTLRQMAEQIIRNKDENFSNARLIRKVFERTRMKQAMRTSDNMISAEDIQAVFAESDMRALLDSVQVQRRIGFAG